MKKNLLWSCSGLLLLTSCDPAPTRISEKDSVTDTVVVVKDDGTRDTVFVECPKNEIVGFPVETK